MTDERKELKYLYVVITNGLRAKGYDAIPGDGQVHVRRRADGLCASVPLRWFLSVGTANVAEAARVMVECVEELAKAGAPTGNEEAQWHFANGSP